MRSKARVCFAIGALLLTTLGCAQERPPINRVQSDALAKSFFVGSNLSDPSDDPEFYWRNYVVDASASQSLVGVGSWGGVDRVRWEITEDLLVAHKAYQVAKGEDDKGVPQKTPNGTVVAAFSIKSHFDIKRAYNPTTGEEMNVIEENTTDRPWYEREYMRVDWSKNLVDNPMWDDMFIGKLFGNIKITPASHYVNDPASPEAPHFDAENGYFDVTTHYYVEPEQSDLYPGIPTCAVVGFYTGSSTYECDAQDATVRSSFWRVDPNDDFEPLDVTHASLDIVGNPGGLSTPSLQTGLLGGQQQGWDPGYGFTDSLYHRFAHIHNIWKRSHQDVACDSNDDLDANGTADACESAVTGYKGNAGSQCDVAVGKCTIPYRDREIRTVGYWFNKELPADLQDASGKDAPAVRGAAEEIVLSWDQLLTNAVARAREVECRRTGGTREDCEAQLFDPNGQMLRYGGWLIGKPLDTTPVLTACHNPVRDYDRHETCGAKGSEARLGDIRYNFLAYWPYESRAPWGGIGNWGSDPLTGEIRGAAAMIMGRSVTYAAAKQRDIIQLALGDISVEDVTNGVPAANYVHQLQNGFAPATLSGREIQKRLAAIDATHAQQSIGPAPIQGATIQDKVTQLMQMQKSATLDVEGFSNAQLEFDALAQKLRGGVYEAQLVDSHWLVGAAGLSPDTETSDDVLNTVSPLRGLDPGGLRALHNDMKSMLASRGVCFEENDAPVLGSIDLQGLAKYFKQKYPDGQYDAQSRGEAIYHDLVIEAFKGIAIHEVGHSLGLLHNFASSWDAANFHPQYWQLRTQEGKATASCNGVPRSGDTTSAAADTCMGPRYLDPATDDEQGRGAESRPGIDYYAQTSVMEYPLERFDETSGLGQYDAQAMKALYGRVLETFDDAAHGGLAVQDQEAFAPRLQTQLTELDYVVRATAPFAGQSFAKPTHYTELARMMKTFDPSRCRDATDEEKAIAGWRVVHGKVCAPAPRDHAAWSDFEDGPTQAGVSSSAAPAWHTRPGTKTGEHMVRWKYRWGEALNSYFHVNASDAGADPYEVTVNTVRQFDAVYPWTYFRRQNREYMYADIPFAVARNTLERLRAYHWNVANGTAFYSSFGKTLYDEIAGSDDWHRPDLMAETEMFNAFARILLTPEPGDYAAMSAQPVDAVHPIYDVAGFGGKPTFQLGAGDGRFIGEEFNSDPDGGGSWDYLNWIRHAGFGVEKTYAAMALTDGRPVLMTINRDNYLDGRAVKINFRNDMPSALDRLIAGVLADDWDAVGMWVPSGQKAPVPALLDLTNTTSAPVRPANAEVLFPNVGYKQQLGIAMFANLYSRLNTDMQLVNKMRIWIDGQVGQINVPDDQQVRFYDPASGYTYIARRYGNEPIDGKLVERGIASRMLEHANALLAASYKVQLDANGAPILDQYGTPQLACDAAGQPVLLDDSRISELTAYVGLLDATRQMGEALGYGPLGGASED